MKQNILKATKVLEKVVCVDSFTDLWGRVEAKSLDSTLIMINKAQKKIII